MAWSDINFDNIITGAITGPAIDSFSLYLNEFSGALDERLNMLRSYQKGQSITLPNIQFTEKEIRNADFWERYRQLLEGFFEIWESAEWYESQIINDIVNSENYLIDETSLRSHISSEVFDILQDPYAFPVCRIWSADVLNGMYLLYQFLTIVLRSKTVSSNLDNQTINRVNVFRSQGELIHVSFNGNGTGDSYSQAQSNFLSSLNPSTLQNGNLNFTFKVDLVSAVDLDENDQGDLDENYLIQGDIQNNSEYYYLAKDLQGNTLNMNIYPFKVIVFDNYIKLTNFVNGNLTSIIEGPYDPSIPVVENSSMTVFAAFESSETNFNIETGNHHTISFNTTREDTSLALLPISPPSGGDDGDGATRQAEFLPDSVGSFLVDINNSALEYNI